MNHPIRLPHRTPAHLAGVFSFCTLLAQQQPPSPRDLLQLAFDAASALPTVPHQKNRARVQESVVAGCLALGETELAEAFARRIDDWRRGTCLADVAIARITGGAAAGPAIAELLASAGKVAETAAGDPQPWRRDRIRARLARAWLLLGNDGEARRFAAGVAPADLVEFEAELAKRAPIADFAAELRTLDGVFAAGQFEPCCNTMRVCVQWYDRFFADADRRRELAGRVLEKAPQLPPQVRAGFVADLAEVAGRRGERAEAVRLLDRAEALLVPGTSHPEEEIALQAGFALRRAKAGDAAGARKTAAAALATFHASRDHIVDVYRGTALRPIAAVYVALGDTAEAARVFRNAIEEGQQNPNGRPRAEDLAAVCVTMATTGFVPDEALWTRLREVRKGLRDPW